MSQLTAKMETRNDADLGGEHIVVSYHLAGSALSFRHSIGLKAKDQALAKRLCKAIEAGAVVKNVRVAKDNQGAEYLASDFCIRMRCANADLKRLGY